MAKLPQELKSMIGRLAQTLQAQQSVPTKERFATVADLVVDVAETPIREHVRLLRNIGQQACDEGGFRGSFTAAVHAVERPAPFVPVEFAAITAPANPRPDLPDDLRGVIGRAAVLRELRPGKGRERFTRGAV